MISGATRLAAVIGDPVRHSLSPAIHNAAFAAASLDWIYLALPVKAGDGGRAIEAMRTMDIRGLSVTMPHKADVAAAADGLTEAARSLGVSNCLFWDGDKIIGDSTDGDGFVASYEADFGTVLQGKKVMLLGAGGAARSIVEAVGRAGAAELLVVNRSVEKAELVATLADQAVVGPTGDQDLVATMDVVINATAVGMTGGPDADGIPVPVDGLHADQQIIDIVYQPRVTPLLAAAEKRGAATANGVSMLVHQAALAFERWTGTAAPVAAMTAAVSANS